jgi:hypothetical protein
MIRSLTIIENKDNAGNVAYQLSGDLPIDEAAKTLVIVAFNTNKTESKKEGKPLDVVEQERP